MAYKHAGLHGVIAVSTRL